MKKARFLGAVLAGVMSLTVVPAAAGISEPFSVTAEAASKLAAPTGLKATVSGSTVKLTWNAVKGADAYRVYKLNSETNKYETYKNVSSVKCNVKNLSKGTYRFRVAALVKNGDSYKVQTKSSAIKAKVGSTSTTKTASKGIIDLPKFGTTGKKAVAALGLKNYQYEKTTSDGITVGMYAGTVKINGAESQLIVLETEKGVYFAAVLIMDGKAMTFANAYSAMKKAMGKEVMDMNILGMNMYMWADEKTQDVYTIMGADSGNDSMTIYYALNYSYAPAELKKGSPDNFSLPDLSGLTL